jgi:hypothetical protein
MEVLGAVEYYIDSNELYITLGSLLLVPTSSQIMRREKLNGKQHLRYTVHTPLLPLPINASMNRKAVWL